MSAIPAASRPFLRPGEMATSERFLDAGYIIAPAEDRIALDRIRELVAGAAARHLDLAMPAEPGAFLDTVHRHVDVARLNALRLAVLAAMGSAEWLRPAYFALARGLIETIAGNELAMQRRINLSVQLPQDDSSLLPIHSDSWSGDAPFEVVVWIPLVDCFATKTMFFVPPPATRRLHDIFAQNECRGAEAVFEAARGELSFLDVPYGSILLFDQNCAHGNRVNREATTRWSLNCRFKGVFSPYADKRLGEFFEPITLRPASRIGLAYRLPGGFDPDA